MNDIALRAAIGAGLFAIAAVMATNTSASDYGTVKNSSVPDCVYYDRLAPRGSETPVQSTCDTVFPEMGGVRKVLSDNGWFSQTLVYNSLTYDILGSNHGSNAYNGERPSYTSVLNPIATYDLSRWGLNEHSQLATEFYLAYNSFEENGPNVAILNRLSVYLPFWDDRLVVQAGYYDFGSMFYGGVIGTGGGASALAPTSSFFYQLGVQGFRIKPGIDVRLYSEDKRWYNHFGVTRGTGPDGSLDDYYDDRFGLKFTSPGGKATLIDEVGYRVESMPGQKNIWLRGGAVYNFSDYNVLDGSGDTAHDYGFYLIGDFQITQPNSDLAYQGWGIQARVSLAPKETNAIAQDYGVSLYKLGTFASRPGDLFALGYARSIYSDTLVGATKAAGQNPETAVNVFSASYTFRLQSGTYLKTGLTYTDNPTFLPKMDGALNANIALALTF